MTLLKNQDIFKSPRLPRRQRLKPGPIVTATAERSTSVKFALSSACWTTCENEAWLQPEWVPHE